MLGLARHAQYAGWGSTDFKATLNSTSTFASAISYPGYSLNINTTNRNTGVREDGEYDLSNYFTGSYFPRRMHQMHTLKLLWPTANISTTDNVSFHAACQVANNGDNTNYFNSNWQLSDDNTTLTYSVGFYIGYNGLTMPGNYAQYMDRWITVHAIRAENSGFFADWSGTNTFNSSNPAMRLCMFDTETGELLGKRDHWENGGFREIDYSTWPSATVPTNITGSYGVEVNWFGSQNFTTNVSYETRLSNYWLALGQAFDPLQPGANTTWRTKQPDSNIDGAEAWLNITLERFEEVGGRYWVTAENTDLYSQANNRVLKNGNSYFGSDWTGAYSTDLFKDRT